MNRTFAAATPPADGKKDAAPAGPPRMDLTNQLQDAEAAYAMIVKRASEWGVDTARLGMIGFSAGAGLTMHCTLNSKSMKLHFIGPIYGGMGPVEVPKNAPPMFNVIATDDFLFRGQFGVIDSWFKAGRPLSFTFTRMAATASALGIRTEPAIVGSMPSCTGLRLTTFSLQTLRSDQDAGSTRILFRVNLWLHGMQWITKLLS